MVKPTIEDIQHSDLTPLERELALASFGAEALTVAQMEESLAALESAISDAHAGADAKSSDEPKASAPHPEAAPASRESAPAPKRTPDPALLAYQYLQTLPQIAASDSSKVWIVPSELTAALQGLATAFTPTTKRGSSAG